MSDHWLSYRQKDVHNEQMLLYGHGDGGGGVTREMLEYIDRSELMVGQPASRYSTAAEFFGGIRERRPKLPTWRGDLYLELHRGTYTTHGRTSALTGKQKFCTGKRKSGTRWLLRTCWNQLSAKSKKAA